MRESEGPRSGRAWLGAIACRPGRNLPRKIGTGSVEAESQDTRERIAYLNEDVKCFAENDRNWGLNGSGGGLNGFCGRETSEKKAKSKAPRFQKTESMGHTEHS